MLGGLGAAVVCGALLHRILPYYVQYHVVNVFNARGHETRFVGGISAAYFVSLYGAWLLGTRWVRARDTRSQNPWGSAADGGGVVLPR